MNHNDMDMLTSPAWKKSMTVSEVRGCGRQKGHTEIYRGADYVVGLIPKTKIEIIVENGQKEHVLNAIMENAHTGKIGDGKIFISPIEKIVRIGQEKEIPQLYKIVIP